MGGGRQGKPGEGEKGDNLLLPKISERISYEGGNNLYLGTLCGQCNLGHSQSYFTSECIPDDQCNPVPFWTTYLFLAVFYVLYCIGLAYLTFRGQSSRTEGLLEHRVTFSAQRVELDPVSSDTNELPDGYGNQTSRNIHPGMNKILLPPTNEVAGR